MDSIERYTTLIKEALSVYAAKANKHPDPHFDETTVFDDTSQRYLIMRTGWKDVDRIQQVVLDIAIRNGKIWIEDDWTEDGVATYFLDHGVPNEQIVLGFQAPIMRPYTKFAVA